MGNAGSSGARDQLIDLPEDIVNGLEENFMASVNNLRTKLGFHHVHGEKIQLSKGGKMAKRVDSFCQGLAFSDRPIGVDEIVCLKFTEVSTNWSGVLRFGVTNTDPSNLANSLPRFACPDLTSKEGNWAKAIAERYCQQGSILHFYVRENGELYYGINGIQKGLFLSGINTNAPMYVLLDIYGNSNCLEFLDPAEVPPLRKHHQRLVGMLSSSSTSGTSTSRPAPPPPPPATHTPSPTPNSPNAANVLVRELSERLSIGSPSATPSSSEGPSSASQQTTVFDSIAPKYYSGVRFDGVSFHAVHGKNAVLSSNKTVAHRLDTEYANGYVFTNRPIRLNERIVVQVLHTMPAYQGGMAFGMTSCDPIHLRPEQLPDDSDLLLDRGEYWVVAKDVATSPKQTDELAFHIDADGQVFFTRNNAPGRVIMHVDQTQKMWMFFDVYGTTQRIKMLGSTSVTTQPRPDTSSSNSRRQSVPASVSGSTVSGMSQSCSGSALLDSSVGGGGGPSLQPQPLRVNLPSTSHASTRSHHPPPSVPPPTVPNPSRPPVPPPRPPQLNRHTSVQSPSSSSSSSYSAGTARGGMGTERKISAPQPSSVPSGGEGSECSVCMSEACNSVLYSCGHMCMCHECAMLTWEKKGECPVCRAPIKDVIKIYKT